MKKILVLMAIAMVATASFGWVSVAWNVEEAFLSCNDPTVAATADEQTTQIIWDLVFTTTDSVAAPSVKDGLPDYGADQLVSRRTWTTGSSSVVVEDMVKTVTQDNPASTTPLTMVVNDGYIKGTAVVYKDEDFIPDTGKFYSAVFQYLSNGDIYYSLTDLVKADNWDHETPAIAPTPTSLKFASNYEDDDIEGTQINVKLEQPTQVPEPATMSLLGLGALAMVLRRKLRK